MTPEEMKARTKQFALRVMKVVDALPKNPAARIVAGQILRCSTSVRSNYRAACRARSKKEFVSKISIVLEEADESTYWLELIAEGELLPPHKVDSLLREAREI